MGQQEGAIPRQLLTEVGVPSSAHPPAGPLRAEQPTLKFVMDTSKFWFKPTMSRDRGEDGRLGAALCLGWGTPCTGLSPTVPHSHPAAAGPGAGRVPGAGQHVVPRLLRAGHEGSRCSRWGPGGGHGGVTEPSLTVLTAPPCHPKVTTAATSSGISSSSPRPKGCTCGAPARSCTSVRMPPWPRFVPLLPQSLGHRVGPSADLPCCREPACLCVPARHHPAGAALRAAHPCPR